MTPEREAFEAWARKEHWRFPPQTWDGQKYLNSAIQCSWRAWCAGLMWKETTSDLLNVNVLNEE